VPHKKKRPDIREEFNKRQREKDHLGTFKKGKKKARLEMMPSKKKSPQKGGRNKGGGGGENNEEAFCLLRRERKIVKRGATANKRLLK